MENVVQFDNFEIELRCLTCFWSGGANGCDNHKTVQQYVDD